MLAKMTDADWITVLNVFEASRSRRGYDSKSGRHIQSTISACILI
jgi:hypothetical protein